ncbi:MAG: hypothetical protein IT348_01935 [Candidatus Eisenbacteria bacterium]|nr:hypothetical protein [Candidatus Eisenbacteria bacterium]
MRTKWPTVTLGEVARLTGGVGFPERLQGRRSGEIPFFKVSDMNAEQNARDMVVAANYVSIADARSLGAPILPAGTVVFPKVGAALLSNRRRLLTVPSCVDNNIMAAIPSRLAPEVLLLLLERVDLSRIAQTSALPSVTQGMVSRIRVPVLSDTAQAALAGAARHFDGSIGVVADLLAAKRRLKRALMQRLLTSTHGHYDVAPLGDLVDMQYGLSEPTTVRGKFPVIGMGSVSDGALSLENLARITISDEQALQLKLQSGDILFNRTNSEALVGKSALFGGGPEETYLYASYMLRFRPRQDRVVPGVLAALMEHPPVLAQIRSFATKGVSQCNINPSRLAKHLALPVLPLELQVSAARAIEICQRDEAATSNLLSALHLQKRGVIQKLLSGEIQ